MPTIFSPSHPGEHCVRLPPNKDQGYTTSTVLPSVTQHIAQNTGILVSKLSKCCTQKCCRMSNLNFYIDICIYHPKLGSLCLKEGNLTSMKFHLKKTQNFRGKKNAANLLFCSASSMQLSLKTIGKNMIFLLFLLHYLRTVETQLGMGNFSGASKY